MVKQTIDGLLYSDNKPVHIEIESGLIKKITRPDKRVASLIIAPGLIDLQINGIEGIGFSEENMSEEGIHAAVTNIWSLGVTTFLPTLITLPRARLIKNLMLLSRICKDSRLKKSVYGFHLEGPYISAEDGPRGAHNRLWVKDIDELEFNRYVKASDDRLALLTLDPAKQGALALIQKCVKRGIRVALGHHNATVDEINRAVEAGASLSTHLGNACSVYMHRHYNPIWPQLAHDSLKASVIADGFHLLPEELRVFYRVKTSDKLILISDMTMFSGMAAGKYKWQDQEITISAQGKVSLGETDMLAGAYSPLLENIAHMIKSSGCSMAEAIEMATKTPAALLGLKDRGIIAEGKRADLILFNIEDNKPVLQKTILSGEEVFVRQ